jgi:hypothetical protein
MLSGLARDGPLDGARRLLAIAAQEDKPKRCVASRINQAICDHIVDELNNRPRKKLGIKTPADLDQRN